MSRVLTVAREDVRHAVSSRLVWGAVVLLGALFLPSTGTSATPHVHPIGEYLLLLPLDLMTFSLVVVAAVGYGAVVGERLAGTARFVLGLPATRRDLVLGKVLARAGVAALALGVVLLVANGLVFRGYGSPHPLAFWVMGGWMLVYVVVWSAVTVGYSAMFDSRYRTLGALVATYAIFSPDVGVWRILVRPAFALAFTGTADPPTYERLVDAPLWLRATERLNPLVDFWGAMRWSVDLVGPGTPAGGPLPHVLGAAVFVAFGAIPLAVGLRRFERADLGSERSGFDAGDRLWRALGRARTRVVTSVAGSATDPRSGRVRLLAVADVRHALQNWVVAGALVATVLLVAPGLWETVDPGGIATVTDVLVRIPVRFALPVLVLGIAVGHDAVAGERAAGTVRFALGTPASRRELVLAKVCSRVGIAVATLVPLLLFAEALVVARLGGAHPGAFLAWAGWVLLFAAVWTTVFVGVSAAVASRYRALAVVFATYLLFSRQVGLWDPLVRPAVAFVFTGRFSAADVAHAADPPAWFAYADALNPFVALATVREGLLVAAGYGTRHTELVAPLFGYAVCVLGLFALGALAVGTRRFERADLG
ncbi:MAG: ABC transporter permease subunit [Haloarculaceae archaeon]